MTKVFEVWFEIEGKTDFMHIDADTEKEAEVTAKMVRQGADIQEVSEVTNCHTCGRERKTSLYNSFATCSECALQMRMWGTAHFPKK